ncbi:hypothetical protein R1flu_003559 [Riccia fluitans]|uniref:Endonuclease/exonuclease/phosphatase domain-containing protein n=1 Tax=Riccia fluitans TaxID=41844 RepID=A0ABD1Y9C5_9MARC
MNLPSKREQLALVHRNCGISVASQELKSGCRKDIPLPSSLSRSLSVYRKERRRTKTSRGCWRDLLEVPGAEGCLNNLDRMKVDAGESLVPSGAVDGCCQSPESPVMPDCLSKQLCGQSDQTLEFKEQDSRSICLSGDETILSCTTLNILAPIYKRLNEEGTHFESNCRDSWLRRNERILEMLVKEKSSIICLQEFWLGNDELVSLYEKSLTAAGYGIFKLARTNKRGDGLFTAYRKDGLEVLDYSEILFYDCGDRVAQFLHMKGNHLGSLQELLVVNTHLIFPHNSNFCLIRLRQVYKILDYLEKYIDKMQLPPMPIILCGDWNGSKRGQVYKFLRARGFISSYDIAHQYSDSDEDAHRWVSHRNHRGNICGVDFIWLLNPSKHQRPLQDCWKEAVFMIVKFMLLEKGIKDEKETIKFFDCEDATEEDLVSLEKFKRVVDALGLTDEDSEGLTSSEIEDLLQTMDPERSGVMTCGELRALLNLPQAEAMSIKEKMEEPFICKDTDPSCGPAKDDSDVSSSGPLFSRMTTLKLSNSIRQRHPSPDFDVKDAHLFPPEVEQGFWPDSYSLSDHAFLTAVFSTASISAASPLPENAGRNRRPL